MSISEREKELQDLEKQLGDIIEHMTLSDDIKELILTSRALIHHLLLKHVKTEDIAKCGKCQKFIFGSGIQR